MIIFHEVHKQFGHKVLLDSVSETLESSARIGVIGVNGAGKSVLLKMIAGGEEPDRGGIVIPNDFRIAYLPQEIDVEASDSVMQYVLKPFRELLHTEHLYKELSLHHEDTKEYQKITAALDKVQKKQYIYDVFSIQARAKAFLAGLGVAEASWNESIDLLSGGFRMRVILVRLLLQQPDFLLLDEPTNHLDMDSLIWLESFLQRFDGGMAIVSHDRAFLDRVTDTTAELVNGKLCLRKESVSGYLAWKEEYNLQVKRQADSMSEKIARAERFVERFKAKATKATQAHS
ncbi:MAG: ATP-binding cassette domain-containing protein, partial [Fibrobacterota bacterium]